MKKNLQILFLMLFSSAVYSQLDTKHFLPPLTSSTHKFIGGAGAGYQVIYLSTPSKTPVNYTIYRGDGTVLYTGTVSNGIPKTHGGEGGGAMTGLATPLMVNFANLNKVKGDKGIRVVADAPVYCNLRIRSPNNAQAASITAKGRTALGTTFRLGHIPTPQKASNWGLQSLGSKLATVGFYATEDNTTITVDLTRVKPLLWGAGAPNTNGTFTVNLNKGQTYTMALRNQDAPNRNAGAGFSGGLVTSNKPIAVSTASMGGYVTNTWQADYGADQIVPIEEVGTTYAVVRGASNDNNLEQVMVVAHQDGTEIKVNGAVVKTINAGQIYKVHGSKYVQGAMLIETNKPAYAYQMMMGSSGGEKKTPGMNFIPPISCKTSSYVDNIPLVHKIGNVNYKGTVSIVTTKTGADLELFINGVKSNNKLGTPKNVPNSDYRFYKISNLTGNIAVYSKTIALVSFTGYSGAAGFGGYFSGWKEVTVSDSANCLPGYLFEPIPKPGTYKWFKDGIEIAGETNDSLFATESGNYTFERSNAGCKDTSDVIPAVAVNQFSFDGDTTFCPGDSVQLSIIGSGFDSLAWENGSGSNSVWLKSQGVTGVRVYSDVTKDCYVDTFVTTTSLPALQVALQDTTICFGDSVTLDAGNPGKNFLWSTGATTQTILVGQAGNYHVAVSDGTTSCAGLDTVTVSMMSCNTDAQVTKTDKRDKYMPGTSTQYTIVAKNNGPNDFTGATVVDPVPSGVAASDVTWSAVSHGSATSQSVGTQTGALNDVVDIPVGDSVVYTVKLTTPVTFLGDLVNTVTIKADRDTFAANDMAIDKDTVDCTFAVEGTINSKLGAWQQVGPVISGLTYNFSSNGGTKTFTATNGPKSGQSVFTVIYNTGTGNHISLAKDRYTSGDSFFNTISGLYDNTPHSWTGLSGVGGEQAPILGFMAFIDQNGNGKFDSGSEEYIRDVNQLTMTPTTTGELYMAFYDDGVYTDNGGVITIKASLGQEEVSLASEFKICKGDSVQFDAGNPSAVSWDWSTGENTQLISAKSSGQYTVKIVTFGGCFTTDTMNLLVDSVQVTLPPDTALCEGESWTIDAGLFDTWAWNTGDSTQTITVDSAGIYELKVTNQFGCRDSDQVALTINALPLLDLGPDSSICIGDSVLLNAQNSGANYSWNTGSLAQSIQIKQSGTYDVIVTDVNGCIGKDTMELIVNQNPMVDLGNDVAFCEPGSVIFTDKLKDFGDSYLWSTGSVADSISVNASQTVYLNVTDTNGCKGYDTVNVAVNPLPILDLGNDTSFCIGGEVSLNANNAGSRFVWSTGEITQQITVDQSGTYGVQLTDVNGCSASDSVSVVVHLNPVVDLGNDTVICEPDFVTIAVGSWTSQVWSTGENGKEIQVNSTQTIYVDVLDGNDCPGSDTLRVQVNPLPVVDLGNDTTICLNETVLLNAENLGYLYSWNTGATSQTIEITEGFYKVQVQDAFGCSGQDSIIINLDLIPDPYPEKEFRICAGEELTLSPANGFENYAISWPGLSASSSFTVNASGEYSSSVTSAFCSDTFELKLEVVDLPVFAIVNQSAKDKVCFDYETVVLEMETNNLNGLTFEWSTGEIASGIEVSQAGIYELVVANDYCEAAQEIELLEYCPPSLYVPNAFSPNQDGINDVFNAKGLRIVDYELFIYDRWGLQLFKSEDLNVGWNGEYKGQVVQQDVYVYKIFYSFLKENGNEDRDALVGTVTVVK